MIMIIMILIILFLVTILIILLISENDNRQDQYLHKKDHHNPGAAAFDHNGSADDHLYQAGHEVWEGFS